MPPSPPAPFDPLAFTGLSGPALVAVAIGMILVVLLVINRLPKR